MRILNVLFAAFGNMIGSVFHYGYAMGVMNSLTPDLEKVFANSNMQEHTSFFTALSLTQGLWALGGALGSIIGGYMGAKIGRRNTLLLNNIFISTGILCQFGAFQFGWSYGSILAGRTLNGIGCGVAMTISPMMLTEISPVHLRGAFGSSYSLFLNLGLFGSFVLAWKKSDLNFSFVDSAAFVIIFPLIASILQLLILPFCHESPNYLKMIDREKFIAAKDFYGVTCNQQEASEKSEKKKLSSGNETKSISTLMKDPLFTKPLGIGCTMMLIQQLTGISAIQFYSTTIFETAGMVDPEFGTVMVGVLKVCCVSITIFIVDRFGRKKLMILSLVGMFISCLSTAIILVCYPAENLSTNETSSSVTNVTSVTGIDTNDVTDISSKISVVFVLLFVVFFQFGAGPIPPFITSEMFQSCIRPKAVAITAFVNWMANAIIGVSYPHINEAIGGAVFFIFGSFLFLSILYVTCFVPETKNRTIEEVQLHFAPSSGSNEEGDSLMTGDTSNPQSSSSASSTNGSTDESI